jgi:hypothetical protein
VRERWIRGPAKGKWNSGIFASYGYEAIQKALYHSMDLFSKRGEKSLVLTASPGLNISARELSGWLRPVLERRSLKSRKEGDLLIFR